jgi:hypothetical protein
MHVVLISRLPSQSSFLLARSLLFRPWCNLEYLAERGLLNPSSLELYALPHQLELSPPRAELLSECQCASFQYRQPSLCCAVECLARRLPLPSLLLFTECHSFLTPATAPPAQWHSRISIFAASTQPLLPRHSLLGLATVSATTPSPASPRPPHVPSKLVIPFYCITRTVTLAPKIRFEGGNAGNIHLRQMLSFLCPKHTFFPPLSTPSPQVLPPPGLNLRRTMCPEVTLSHLRQVPPCYTRALTPSV